jgi:ABC-type antimicrobial peptide transport system permease subunit
VAIINRALASIYFANQDPVGQAISTGNDTIRIVGVVGNVPIGNLDEKIPPTVYFPVAQSAERNMALVVRTNADLATTTALVRRAVGTIDPQVGLTQAMTMDDFIDASPSVFMRRLPLVLIGAFALTALALAFVGIYGVVTYSVVQRTREMGIRTALGAQPSSLMALVVRHGAAMAAAGIALGAIGAIAAGRLVQGLLYGVSSGDPVTYLSVACALAVATIAATLMPARRAMRIDPATALRAE